MDIRSKLSMPMSFNWVKYAIMWVSSDPYFPVFSHILRSGHVTSWGSYERFLFDRVA